MTNDISKKALVERLIKSGAINIDDALLLLDQNTRIEPIPYPFIAYPNIWTNPMPPLPWYEVNGYCGTYVGSNISLQSDVTTFTNPDNYSGVIYTS